MSVKKRLWGFSSRLDASPRSGVEGAVSWREGLGVLAAISIVTLALLVLLLDGAREREPLLPETRSNSEAQTLLGRAVPLGESRTSLSKGSGLGTDERSRGTKHLHVLDVDSRQPIGEAEVWLWDVDEEPQSIGTTDPAGVISVAGYSGSMVITHPNYERTLLSERSKGAEETVVLLSPGGVIRGRLLHDQDDLIGTRPLVLAYPDSAPPSKSRVTAALHGLDPTFHLARTDETGFFEIRGLRRGQRFTLAAAGGGWVMPTRRQGVPADTLTLELSLERLYGALVVLRGSDGQAVRTSAQLWALPGPQWNWEDLGAHGVGTDSLEGALLGLPSELASRSYSDEYLFLFWSEQRPVPEQLGPIRFTGHLAGYEPCSADVWLEPLADQVESVQIELVPTVSTWASVEVNLVGQQSTQIGGSIAGGIGHLVLKELESGLLVTNVLENLNPGALVFDGVPEGDYHVYLTTKYGYFNSADAEGPLLLQVRGSDRIKVSLDLSSLSSITFDVKAGDRDYTGAFAVEVQGRDRLGSAFAHFDGPPYFLQGLMPGDYRFTPYTPEYMPSDGWVKVGTQKEGSDAAVLRFRLP